MRRGFVRVPGGFLLQVPEDWWELLESLTQQLVDLLRSEDGVPDAAEPPTENPFDPFQAWEAEFGDATEPMPEHEDPALRRLFPNPYPDDAEAAAEHRRFSEPDQRRRKITDAERVLAHLTDPAAQYEEDATVIPDADVELWLRTLNALRLVLASRLGIETGEDAEQLFELEEDDPRWMMAAVMDALAELQTQLIVLGD